MEFYFMFLAEGLLVRDKLVSMVGSFVPFLATYISSMYASSRKFSLEFSK